MLVSSLLSVSTAIGATVDVEVIQVVVADGGEVSDGEEPVSLSSR